jgi:TetR/AcrR family transcriptional regulator
MSDIAKQVGLPKANVYYYFGSKEAVYRAVIARLIRGWDNALKHIRADGDPLECLEAYVRAKLDYARRNADESRVFAAEVLRGSGFLSRQDRSHMRLVTRRHAEIVDHWIAAGKLRRVDSRRLFILLWAATQFYIDFDTLARDALEKPRLDVRDYELAAKIVAQTVLRGLRP